MASTAVSNLIQALTSTPLARALLLSLSLHLALLAVVQVKAIPEVERALVIDARLVALAKAKQPGAVQGQPAGHPEPLPVPSKPAGPISKRAEAEMDKETVPEPPVLSNATPVSSLSDSPHSTVPSPLAQAAPSQLPSSDLPSEVGVSVPVLSSTRWYGAREVDMHPKALQRFKPPYPDAARKRGQEGSVKLRLRIDEFGRVQEAEVVEGNPPGVFDAVALETIKKVGFEPARKAGRPVRYDGEYRYRFVLD